MPHPLDYHTPTLPPLPKALKAVAWLFIAFGILSACEIVIALLRGNLDVNLGILGMLIGRGLLRLDRNSRRWALIIIWITLIVAPLGSVIALASSKSGMITVAGRLLASPPTAVALLPMALVWCVAIWQYRVLVRVDIHELFRTWGK